MSDNLYMVWALIAGLLLGTIFFGGLWVTVRKGVHSKSPAIWFFVSFLFRVSITLIGFYYITNGNLQSLFICLIGFVTARYIIVRLTRTTVVKQMLLNKEVTHET